MFTTWKLVALLGSSVVGGALAWCQAIPGCFPGREITRQESQVVADHPAARSSTRQLGVKPMSIKSYAPGQIEHANEANFDELVLRSSVPVLVDFYADWCGPCRMIAPTLAEIAREMPEAKVVKVNVDHSAELAGRYRVSSIPTLMVFRSGEPTARLVGLAGKAQLKGLLVK